MLTALRLSGIAKRLIGPILALDVLMLEYGCAPSRHKGKTMNTDVTTLQVHELPQGGPTLVVVPEDRGATASERYRQAGAVGTPLPAGRLLLAIIRSPVLATPDRFQVTTATRSGNTFQIATELRRYTGPLAANVETVVLVQVELGILAGGSYVVVVTEAALDFHDLHHPEQATNPTSTSQQLHFEVR